MCSHHPTCPPVTDGFANPLTARVVADHPEQGWSLLCNGVVRFDDGGALLPEGTSIPAVETSGSVPADHTAHAVAVAA